MAFCMADKRVEGELLEEGEQQLQVPQPPCIVTKAPSLPPRAACTHQAWWPSSPTKPEDTGNKALTLQTPLWPSLAHSSCSVHPIPALAPCSHACSPSSSCSGPLQDSS